MATAGTTGDAIVVNPLHPTLGAKIVGVDFRLPVADDIISSIKDAWSTHLVLVFPDQPLSDEQHVEMTRYFGDPEIFHQDIIKSARVREIFRVANTDENGNLMQPEHPTMQQLASARRWHTDSSYRPKPAIGSLLHGIQITATGGVTCFANMYAVFDALPARLKQKVEGRKARHDFENLSRAFNARTPTAAERLAMPPVWQPLVRRHPVTHKKSLYISPIYNDQVEGMADTEAQALIEELAEFASREEFVYRHHWTKDDIVMSDNRCTMHLVTAHDANVPRVMHRTTINGESHVEQA